MINEKTIEIILLISFITIVTLIAARDLKKSKSFNLYLFVKGISVVILLIILLVLILFDKIRLF